MTTGRHLVHESIHDEYVAALAEKATQLPVGDPAKEQVALGPIIDDSQRDRIHALVQDSVSAGAPSSQQAAPTSTCSTGPLCSPRSVRICLPTHTRSSAQSRRLSHVAQWRRPSARRGHRLGAFLGHRG